MSNSFRVGSISAALNLQTGGFMQGIRDAVSATSGIRAAMQATGAATVASTTAMSVGMKAVATQAGITSGAMGLLGKTVTTMAAAANLSVAGTIARFVGMRSAAVAAAREIDQVNRASNASRIRSFTPGGTAVSSALSTGNEAAAMGALTARMSGLTATAGAAAMGVAGVGLAAVVVARQLKPAIDASLELEHSFAFVRKTVDGTKEQLDQISESIQNMALRIPISVKELNGVAAAAGQLGIAREDVVGFTEVMAGMGIATDMTAEQAAVSLAQWSNITGMAAEDTDNLASAIVYLGNNTATTESQITNMSLRLAGASRVVGLTNADMAGLSASLASMGIWAESGGNAMSRIMYSMQEAVSSGSDELKDFALVSGKSASEFADQFNKAPMQAISDFIGGIASAGKDASIVLRELGITEMESQRAIIGLAGGHEKLKRNIEGSNEAFRAGTALGKEVNVLYDTGVSKTQLLKNATSGLSVAVGDNLTRSYEGLISSLTRVVNQMTAVIEKTNVLRNAIAATTGMFTGIFGRMLVGQATESGAERSIGNSYAINQEGFGKDKQDYMRGIEWKGQTLKDAANDVLEIQSAAKGASVDMDKATNSGAAMVAQLTAPDFTEKADELVNMVDANRFKKGADELIAVWKEVPDRITADVRAAKFEDLWRGAREGMGSIADAAALLPEELRPEFTKVANIIEAEIGAKGGAGGAKMGKNISDELGKELERAMEEAMSFRIELFPEESLAEEVRKITKMAQTFPEIMTGDAVAKAFDDLLVQFEGKGINAVEAIKKNIIGIGPEFAKAMEEAVDRAKVASLEAMMEAKEVALDEKHWSKEGDIAQRGKDRFDSLTDPGGVKEMTEDTVALTAHLQELVDAGKIDTGDMNNILNLDYWDRVKGLASQGFDGLLDSIKDMAKNGQAISAEQFDALGSAAWKEMGDNISRVGASLKGIGGKDLSKLLSTFGQLASVGLTVASTLIGLPALFLSMQIAGVSAAVTVGVAIAIALSVIVLVADAIMLVISLFGGMGKEGKKELKGMAAVIDEIKQASDEWADSLTDKLVDAIKTGQFAWRDFVDEILADITQIAIKQLIVGPLMDLAGSFLPFADGGAFSKGHVVDSPEYFNTKSGPAVRGEAGTEVVMPAVRLNDGTLGVKSVDGGGSGGNVTVQIIDNRSANQPAVEVRESRGSNGESITQVIINEVKKGFIQGDFDNVLGAVQMRGGYR